MQIQHFSRQNQTVSGMILNTDFCKKHETTRKKSLSQYYTTCVEFLTENVCICPETEEQSSVRPNSLCKKVLTHYFSATGRLVIIAAIDGKSSHQTNKVFLCRLQTYSLHTCFSSLLCSEKLGIFLNHIVNEHVKSNKVIFKVAIQKMPRCSQYLNHSSYSSLIDNNVFFSLKRNSYKTKHLRDMNAYQNTSSLIVIFKRIFIIYTQHLWT